MRVLIPLVAGGGNYCNTWTVSFMVKMKRVAARGLLSTAGWDQWSAAEKGDEDAQVMLNDEGCIGCATPCLRSGLARCSLLMLRGEQHLAAQALESPTVISRSLSVFTNFLRPLFPPTAGRSPPLRAAPAVRSPSRRSSGRRSR